MKVKYIALYTILAAIFVFIANIPADLALRQIPVNPAIPISDVRGTIWEGNATIQDRSSPSILSWEVKTSKILALRYYCHLSLSGPEINLSGILDISPFHYAVNNLSGTLNGSLISKYQNTANPSFTNPISFNGISVTYAGDKFTYAEGNFNYIGETVIYNNPTGEISRTTIQPLKGNVSLSGNDVYTNFFDSGNKDMIKILLHPDGWINIELSPDFLHSFDGYDKNDVSLTIKQKLF